MDDWDEEAFIESIKNELCSLWRNKHFSKGDEVTSAARIAVPAGFLQPISQEHPPLAVEQDEAVAPRRRRRLLMEFDDNSDEVTSAARITVPAGFLQPISQDEVPLAVEQDEAVAPRRRRRLLMEFDDSSDDDGDGKSSPPCQDFFTNLPKKRRSRKNVIPRVSAWKNINIPIWSEDSSPDRLSCDRGPCRGDSVQLIVAEISGHALRKERESAAANRITNESYNLCLGPTLEDLVELSKERTSRKTGFGAKSSQKNLKSALSIRFEENSNKEDQEAAERICEGTEFGEKSDKGTLESAERTCKRRDLGAITLPTLDSYKLLQKKLKEAEEENVILVNTIEEERNKSEQEKERLRKNLEDASYMIEELVRKIRLLEGMGSGVTV